MRKPRTVKRLTVHFCTLNIFVNDGTVISDHGELFSVLQINSNLAEYRTTYCVDRQTRSNRIKTHGREDHKCGHASSVLVPWDTKNIVLVPNVHQETDTLLSFPG